MRVPKSDTKNTVAKIKRVHIDKPLIIPRLPVISNDKQRVKLIKEIESYCRQSMEYGDLIKYLRNNINMDECTFLSGFKIKKKGRVIELHHAPYTLFSIVDIVVRKHEDLYNKIDEFDVCEEVMRLHYQGLIGLIPLSVTCHQLVHDNRLNIPLWCVYGRFVEFTKKYYDWIPDDMIMSLSKQIEMSKEYKANPELLKKELSILDVNYVYLDVDGETKVTNSEYNNAKDLA